MSGGAGGDLALLEALLAEWGRGEFWNLEAYADDVVFVRSGPDGGQYHGIEGLTAAWRDFLGAWEDFRVRKERVVPGEGGVYVLLIQLQARGKGSGVMIDAEVANVVSVRDGRVARLEMFWDREAALTAAGAREDAG
jgi:ketosteroid isomerase-like protein